MALGVIKQSNIAVNKARHLIFFEGTELCYNYKTQQWSEITAYDGLGMYSINSKLHDIGLVVFSSGSVDLQDQSTSFAAQTATITTASPDPNQEGRGVITGVRPRSNGGTHAVRVGTQDSISDSVTWSVSTSVNSRSGMANFRSEGRYLRIECVITGGFTSFIGADVDFTSAGRV